LVRSISFKRGYADAIDLSELREGTILGERFVGRVPDERELTNALGMQFVLIDPGTFRMGSDDDSNSKPVHTVTLTKRFYMGATEVTQSQYEAVTGENPSTNVGHNLPVTDVSWADCMEFIRMLNAREAAAGKLPENLTYRLPTEAEWEYACRAGTTTPFPFGENEVLLKMYAWFEDNSGRQPKPVASLKPNPWGLYDMLGNVYEWCQDWFGAYPDGTVTDPTGPATGRLRVARGGAWDDSERHCRSAAREKGIDPSKAHYAIGFRLVMAAKR
jgi:formylglycine-generating enzyme required for sulfatase activity